MTPTKEHADTQAVTLRPDQYAVTREVRAEDFLPLMTVDQAVNRKSQINQFVAKVLREGEDYGTMPGGQAKKVLMKPGAEKLCSIFGLAPKYHKEVIVEDWTGEHHAGEPLFSYEYRCQLWRGDRFMGEAIGSCNSWESKYRYRWVPEEIVKDRPDFDRLPKRGGVKRIFEPLFALEAKRTDGQYGKPAEYWQQFEDQIQAQTAKYVENRKLGKKSFDGWEIEVDSTQCRIPNPDIADVINTCQKMAQKRALVAAVLVVTNCSDAFTQDLEEQMEEPAHHEPEPKAEPKRTQEKPQTAQKSRPVPEQLKGAFDAMKKDLSVVVPTYAKLERLFVQRAGDAGLTEYNRIADAFNERYPKGTSDIEAHKTFILDLWDALEKVKPAEEPKTE